MATAKRNSSKDGVRKITLKSGQVRYEARVNARNENLSKTFKLKADAVAWRTKALSMIHTGTPVPKARLAKFTVADAITEYTKHRLSLNPPMSSNQLTEYKQVKIHQGRRLISELKTDFLEKWLSLLTTEPKGRYKDPKKGVMKPYAKSSARRFFYSLKTAVEWHAQKHNYTVNPNLFKLSKQAKPAAWDGQRERRLRAGEEERLYAGGLTRKGCYTRTDWEAIIGFALETGMRTQEIFFAEFDDVTPEGNRLRIYSESSKTKVGRYVPLSQMAKSIIKAQLAISPAGNKRLFHQFPSADAIGSAFANLTRRVGIEDLHFHDLRHEAISRMCVKRERSLTQIMDMTGHTEMRTFFGYVKLHDEEERLELQAAIAQLNSEVTPANAEHITSS